MRAGVLAALLALAPHAAAQTLSVAVVDPGPVVWFRGGAVRLGADAVALEHAMTLCRRDLRRLAATLEERAEDEGLQLRARLLITVCLDLPAPAPCTPLLFAREMGPRAVWLSPFIRATPYDPLKDFAPLPFVRREGDAFRLVEDPREAPKSFGRMKGFHGQMGMFIRALAYMMSHGGDGLRQVAEDAVLNANYIKARLSDLMSAAFPDGPCMHEALFDDEWLKGTDVTTLDFAKAMIDEGFHPMTMYFPLVVHGAMLIEPTETESKHELDRFIAALRALAGAAKAGDTERFKSAPFHAPLRRLDETQAARKPRLRWKPVAAAPLAAE